MIFYPNGYFNKVSEISLEYLKENNIKGLILDVDNTLIDYYRNMSEDTINWVNDLRQNGIQMCILSNSNNGKKVSEVANKLAIEKYSYFAMKPLKRGFEKAKDMLKLDISKIGVVGDQIFTDVLGANRMKMHSILVDPIDEKDIFMTMFKRPIENAIKRKFIEKKTDKSEKTSNSKNGCITEKVDIDHDKAKTMINKLENERYNREEK